MINIAINGFGRIGRNFLRCVLLDPQASKKIKIVAINVGPANIELTAPLFKHDTLMGNYPGTVQLKNNALVVDNITIPLLAEKNPLKINWKKYGVDWVVEASGKFTKRECAQQHIDAGAHHVLITAPAENEDITIIPGVNVHAFDSKKHTIVALGSCTTNAFIPMLKVLNDNFGIENGMMTTIHAYTNTQVLLDVETKDVRRSRAAALNIIPTSTGVSKLIGTVIPELTGCIIAASIRVPIPKVSLIDFTFLSKKEISAEAINRVFFEAASKAPLKGIINVTEEELVSSDFNGDEYSVVIDSKLTTACGALGTVFGWYDNEWAFSVRLKDFLLSAQK
jgi:glyceraldehyde-3-phosphate dehydrogenase type I